MTKTHLQNELVLQPNLLGSEAKILERLGLYQKVGVTTLSVEPVGSSLEQRLANLKRLMELVKRR